MKAKEKAKELYNKYFKFCNELSHDKNKTLAKLMAITCVDEMMQVIPANINPIVYMPLLSNLQEIKQEIEKL